MNENMKEITAVENKYGMMLFRMGLTHLVDVGHRNLTDDIVEDNIKQILTKGNEDNSNGVVQVMTPKFQCDVVRCAAELSDFSIWTLFRYIKKHVHVD